LNLAEGLGDRRTEHLSGAYCQRRTRVRVLRVCFTWNIPARPHRGPSRGLPAPSASPR